MRRSTMLTAVLIGCLLLGGSLVGVSQAETNDVAMFRATPAPIQATPGPSSGNSNGIEELWRFTTGAQVNSSPVVVDAVVYVRSHDGNLYALAADTGTEQWRFKIESFFSPSPVVVGGVVYIGSADGNVYALERFS